MSRRIHIVIPDQVARELTDLADAAGESPSTLAATLVRNEIANQGSQTQIRKPARAARAAPGSGRPVWLEPYGGDSEWRRQTWGAIVALHGRYPRHLEHLKDGWWNDEAEAEQLSALSAWRAALDEHGQDPREELAFHAQLGEYRETLRSQGGGVRSTWTPGPPPVDWLD